MASENGKKKAAIEAVISKLKAMGCAYIIATNDECFSGGAPPAAMMELACEAIDQMVKQYGDFLQVSQMSTIGYDVRKLAQAIREKQ